MQARASRQIHQAALLFFFISSRYVCGLTDTVYPRPFRRKAVAEEDRFDFLRPVLVPPQKKGAEPLDTAGVKGKRKRGPASARTARATGGEAARKGKRRMEVEAAAAALSDSDLASGGAAASTAGAGVGDLSALAGLDDAAWRRALLCGSGSEPPPAAAGFVDDEDEDYDNL